MPIYEDIEQPMRDYVEEVVLNHSADGGHVERLLKFAEEEKERKAAAGPGGGGGANAISRLLQAEDTHRQLPRLLARHGECISAPGHVDG